MTPEPATVMVDDHTIWRDAVVQPQVVVMDMRLPNGDGARATAEVLAVSPSSRILVLSASDEREDVLEAVKAGATGYLVKSTSKAELAEAVRANAAGRAVFTPGLAGWGRTGARHAEPDRSRDRHRSAAGNSCRRRRGAGRGTLGRRALVVPAARGARRCAWPSPRSSAAAD